MSKSTSNTGDELSRRATLGPPENIPPPHRVREVPISFTLWDKVGNKYRNPTDEEWKELHRLFDPVGLSFPFLEVKKLPEGGDGVVWVCAGLILTKQPMESIHPLFHSGRFFGARGARDPFPRFVGTPWELSEKILHYFRQILSDEGKTVMGLSVEFTGFGVTIEFPDKPESHVLPQKFGGYPAGYNTIRKSEKQLSSTRTMNGARAGLMQASSNPVMHCGDQVESGRGTSTSLGAAIRGTDREYRIMLAAHGFEALNEHAYNKQGRCIGVIRQFFPHSDIALMEPAEDFDFDNETYSNENGIRAPTGEILPHHEVQMNDYLECWSWILGARSFVVVRLRTMIEGGGSDNFTLSRSVGVFGGDELELQGRICGCPFVRQDSTDLVGQFRYQSTENPSMCYVQSAGFLKNLGWACAAEEEEEED